MEALSAGFARMTVVQVLNTMVQNCQTEAAHTSLFVCHFSRFAKAVTLNSQSKATHSERTITSIIHSHLLKSTLIVLRYKTTLRSSYFLCYSHF